MRARLIPAVVALLVASPFSGPALMAAHAESSPPSSGALPDVVGLRPGITAQEAYKFLKSYDRVAKIYVSDTPLPPVQDKPVPFAIAMAQDDNAAEKIQADLTLPPSKQMVWRVTRRLQFSPDKQTSPQNLIASLRKKYGPESYMGSGRAPMLTWYFDEQGQRTTLPGGMNSANCASKFGPTMLLMGVPASHGLQYLLIQPLSQSADDPICRSVVIVSAIMQPAQDQRLIYSLDVVVADLPLETRTHNMTVEMLANGGAAQQQRELDRANKREGPKL